MKRRLTLAITLTLIVTLCGCIREPTTVDAGSEPPALRILMMGGGNGDAVRRISEAASAVTQQHLGCRVSIEMVGLSEYEMELNRLRMDGELPDLFVAESKSALSQLVDDGEVLCLDEFLPQYPALRNEIVSQTEWRNVQFSGRSYAVPFNNNQPYCLAFAMRRDICQELGILPENIGDLDQLHEVLLQVQQAYPELMIVAPNYSLLSPNAWWDGLSNETGTCGVGVLPYRTPMSSELKLITELPEFRDWCDRMYQWRQEGLIPENVSFNQEPRQVLLNTGAAFGGFTRYCANTEEMQAVSQPSELCYALLSQERMDYGENGAAFCVSSNAKDPSLCLRFLQLFYTDTGLLDLCTYGQEDIDYTVDNGGSRHAILEDDRRYPITLWCWPNNRRVLGKAPDLPAADILVSPAAGFWFDSSACKSESAACEALIKQYYKALMSGEIDPDTGIPALHSALLDAGARTVLEEEQRQLEQWLRDVSDGTNGLP